MVDFCGRVEEAFQEDPEANSVMGVGGGCTIVGKLCPYKRDKAMCVPRAPVLISLLFCASYG